MIYDKVKQLAEMQHKSIAAIEREARLSNGTISKWRSAEPTATSLYRVSKALRVDINVLLEGSDQ